MNGLRCADCGRKAPPEENSDDFSSWDVLEDGESIICENWLARLIDLDSAAHMPRGDDESGSDAEENGV